MTLITYRWHRPCFTAIFDVQGKVSAYYPAVVGGPPECCSPAEGGEVEIYSVELVDILVGKDPVKKIHPKLSALLEKKFNAELDEQDKVWEEVDTKLFEAAATDDYYDDYYE